MAVEFGSERLCCNHTRQFLCLLWCLKFDKVPREPLRRNDFEQFGYDDKCPGCANARAGRQQAVDHLEQCRSRLEAILSTTTGGHEQLERARDRFAQVAKERVRAKGGAASRSISVGYSKQLPGSSRSSGSALPPPPAPPPLESPVLAKRSLEQETEMTDETVEQQGESKRRREHPEAPQAAGSSSSSSSES